MGNCNTPEEKIEFFTEWLSLDKYPFKILAITSILADNQRAYRGTLNQFCESLSIQPSSGNKSKIKETLVFLAENNYIKLVIDNQIYTISLAAAAANNPEVITIKKAWYQLIRNNSGKESWGNTLKVFLHLIDFSDDNITTYKEIGKALNISKSTVERCVKIICSIDFVDFEIQKTVVSKKQQDGSIVCLGQKYEQVLNFEK